MQIPFELATLIFFAPVIILIVLFFKAIHLYAALYRKKKNPDYPILPNETAPYLYKGALHKIFLSPFFIIKIIFEKHKDKALAAAAKRVRILIGLYLLVLALEFLFLAFILFSSN